MITQDQLRTVVGATAYDRDGDKIGKIGQVYYDDETGQPTWVTVNTGLFGTNETFVPLQGAELTRRPGHRGLRQGHGQGRPERSPRTATCRRRRSSSSTATTAWTTAPASDHGTPATRRPGRRRRRTTTTPRRPRWAATPPARPPTRR